MAGKKIKSLKFFYGIPHSHTEYSTGRLNPYEAFEYAKKNGLDFLVITDHNVFLSKRLSYKGKSLSKWSISNLLAEKFRKRNENFLPLIGFETKTSFGDFNIINSNTYFTGVLVNFTLLILWMLNNPDSIVIINHPHHEILSLPYDKLLNKLITSVEVSNGSFPNKYTHHDKYLYKLLDAGWKLGVVNGQDNHRANFGDSENLTVMVSDTLNPKTFIDCYRTRSTFSTESKTLKMYFTINDYFMGEEMILTQNNKLRFMIFAEDIRFKIERIEIVSNNNTVIKKISDINLNSIKYLYDHEISKKWSWFLIRIHQEGDRLCISSPIFLSNTQKVEN